MYQEKKHLCAAAAVCHIPGTGHCNDIYAHRSLLRELWQTVEGGYGVFQKRFELRGSDGQPYITIAIIPAAMVRLLYIADRRGARQSVVTAWSVTSIIPLTMAIPGITLKHGHCKACQRIQRR